jgi:hypothetical protein
MGGTMPATQSPLADNLLLLENVAVNTSRIYAVHVVLKMSEDGRWDGFYKEAQVWMDGPHAIPDPAVVPVSATAASDVTVKDEKVIRAMVANQATFAPHLSPVAKYNDRHGQSICTWAFDMNKFYRCTFRRDENKGKDVSAAVEFIVGDPQRISIIEVSEGNDPAWLRDFLSSPRTP